MLINYYFKNPLYLLLLSISLNGQKYSVSQLDSLTEHYRVEGNIRKSIELNQRAFEHYKNTGNKDGIITAQINIGGLLWNLHRYKESLKYLGNAEGGLKASKNITLYAKLYGEYGRNYASLGLLDQSNDNLNRSIYFAKQIKDKKEREKLLYYYYTWKLMNFEELKIMDSVNSIQRKRLELTAQPLTFVHIAAEHIRKKKIGYC